MKSLLTAIVIALAPSAEAAWTPPENPDPMAILREAEADAREGRYAQALDKHLWIHHKSHQYPGMGGVRLSFALGSWKRLGDSYPPALTALKSIRAESEARIRAGTGSFEEFHDLSAIDRALGEQAATAELFAWMDANRPELARRTYSVAQNSLVAARNYTLCAKYLDGAADTDQIIGMHRMNRSIAQRDARMSSFARDSFVNRAATLVALLAVNGRRPEADAAMAEFLKELPDDEFRAQLNRALAGVVPEPWPK